MQDVWKPSAEKNRDELVGGRKKLCNQELDTAPNFISVLVKED